VTPRRVLGAGALLFAAAVFVAAAAPGGGPPREISVRANVDPSGWARLLAKYVDERGFVDYRAWKTSAPDRAALESYLRDLAASPSREASGRDRLATLVNAYNALTIAWVLENFPTESIRSLPDSFTARRHTVGGRKTSLDDIETDLRSSAGSRVHSAISCASRSCPPLSREAYRPERFDEQLDSQMRSWLAREDLNRFEPGENRVRVSEIFRWFEGDFRAAGGVGAVLARFAPPRYRGFLEKKTYRIEYLDYDWGVNDQGGHGKDYGKLNLLWDKLHGKS